MSWIRPIVIVAGILAIPYIVYPLHSWAADPDKVPRIKAAYIHQFSHFVVWPGEEVVSEKLNRNLSICIMGSDRVAEYLERLAGHTHGSSFIRIEHPASLMTVRTCEILYIASQHPRELDEIISAVDRLPVLTVSDTPGFVDQGGMIGFIVKDERVRLEINLPAAQRAQLRISAKLIEVSLRVIHLHANGDEG